MKVTSQRFEGSCKRWQDVAERDANQEDIKDLLGLL